MKLKNIAVILLCGITGQVYANGCSDATLVIQNSSPNPVYLQQDKSDGSLSPKPIEGQQFAGNGNQSPPWKVVINQSSLGIDQAIGTLYFASATQLENTYKRLEVGYKFTSTSDKDAQGCIISVNGKNGDDLKFGGSNNVGSNGHDVVVIIEEKN